MTEFSFVEFYNDDFELVMGNFDRVTFKVTIFLGSVGFISRLLHATDKQICEFLIETEIHENIHKVLSEMPISFTQNEHEFIVDVLMQMIDMDYYFKYSKDLNLY